MPPETIRQAYMNIFVPAQQAASALPPASALPWSERLQTRRTQLGLSQTQAAEQIGIAQSYYSMLEKGARSHPRPSISGYMSGCAPLKPRN